MCCVAYSYRHCHHLQGHRRPPMPALADPGKRLQTFLWEFVVRYNSRKYKVSSRVGSENENFSRLFHLKKQEKIRQKAAPVPHGGIFFMKTIVFLWEITCPWLPRWLVSLRSAPLWRRIPQGRLGLRRRPGFEEKKNKNRFYSLGKLSPVFENGRGGWSGSRGWRQIPRKKSLKKSSQVLLQGKTIFGGAPKGNVSMEISLYLINEKTIYLLKKSLAKWVKIWWETHASQDKIPEVNVATQPYIYELPKYHKNHIFLTSPKDEQMSISPPFFAISFHSTSTQPTEALPPS